jgi:formylglycine-generating enzyme required for sulfatase activity
MKTPDTWRVCRGGSTHSAQECCRAAYRGYIGRTRSVFAGFRLARRRRVRVCRGGSWDADPLLCRAVTRLFDSRAVPARPRGLPAR